MVEKAYAIFRRDLSNYASIAGGDGTHDEHLNATVTYWRWSDGYTQEQVKQWIDDGEPAGAIRNARNAGVSAFLLWIQQQRAAGQPLVAGSISGVNDNMTFTNTNWRRGAHIYMIDRVIKNFFGKRVGMVLRDPYGFEVELRDYTAIYYAVGAGARFNLP